MLIRYFKLLTIIALVSFFVLFAGCNSKSNNEASSNVENDIVRTVEFQHYFSGSLSGGIDQMIERLNSNKKGYKVKAVPIDHEAFKIRINSELSDNNTVDLFSYWAGAKTQAITASLETIDDIWNKMRLDNVFPKAIVESACTYNKKKFLIPITQHYVGIVYNKRMFSELKLDIPNNWNEFLAVCEKIKKSGKIPIALGAKSKWPAQFWFDYIILRTNPIGLRDKLMQGKVAYTDNKIEAVMELWKSLIDKKYFNNNPNDIEWDSGAAEMLYQGKAAMSLMGTWIIGYFGDDKHKWEFGEDYDFFEFPVIDHKIAGCSLGPIDGILVPANSMNKNEAKETIAFFAGQEAQMAMSKGSGAFAPSQQIEEAFYSKPQLRLLKIIRKNPNWAFNYDLATPPEVSEIGLNAFDEFLAFPSEYKLILKEAQTEIMKLNK